MEELFEESDQAGIWAVISNAHLNREDHKGEIKEDCLFCKNFLMPPTGVEGPAISHYSFIIFDVSDPEADIKEIKR